MHRSPLATGSASAFPLPTCPLRASRASLTMASARRPGRGLACPGRSGGRSKDATARNGLSAPLSVPLGRAGSDRSGRLRWNAGTIHGGDRDLPRASGRSKTNLPVSAPGWPRDPSRFRTDEGCHCPRGGGRREGLGPQHPFRRRWADPGAVRVGRFPGEDVACAGRTPVPAASRRRQNVIRRPSPSAGGRDGRRGAGSLSKPLLRRRRPLRLPGPPAARRAQRFPRPTFKD